MTSHEFYLDLPCFKITLCLIGQDLTKYKLVFLSKNKALSHWTLVDPVRGTEDKCDKNWTWCSFNKNAFKAQKFLKFCQTFSIKILQPVNVRLGQNWLTEKNTLAYFDIK